MLHERPRTAARLGTASPTVCPQGLRPLPCTHPTLRSPSAPATLTSCLPTRTHTHTHTLARAALSAQYFWHHVEDVCAGFALGLLMAFCYYR